MTRWFEGKISDSKVLDYSMEVYRKKFKSLIGYQILFSIMMILVAIVFGLFMITLTRMINLDGEFVAIVFVFLIMIFYVSLACVNKAGIFHMTYGYLKGEDIKATEAVGKAFSSFKPIIRVVTALAICLLPIVIIMGIGGVTTTMLMTFKDRLASSIFLSLLFNTLLVSFILATVGSYLFYSFHIAIFEDEKGFESIKRSIRLAKGEVFKNTFRVLSIFIFEWGVYLSVYSAIGAISALIYFVLGKMDGGYSIVSQMMMYGMKVRPLVNLILGILISPIGPVIWTLYYENMKYKKEGLEIHNMVDEMKEKEEKRSGEYFTTEQRNLL